MQKRNFTCVVEYHPLKDRFSAKVTIQKRAPIRISLQAGHFDLADVFITPVSEQLQGEGVYIVRNQAGGEVHKRACSVWDLGNAFGGKVMGIPKEFA